MAGTLNTLIGATQLNSGNLNQFGDRLLDCNELRPVFAIPWEYQ